MNIDAMTFRSLARTILRDTTPTEDEARAIVQLCYRVTRADLDEDDEERELREQLGRHVCALAGISFERIPSPSPLPLPADREARHAALVEVARRLSRPGVRELAYVLAYLLVIADLAVARVENAFVVELRRVLGIEEARASELVSRASEQVTPMGEARPG